MADSIFTELQQHQRDFVGQFLAPHSPRYQLLLAPTGSGKTSTTVAIVESILRTPSRVLFVTPIGMVASEFALGRLFQGTVVKISKAWLRERSHQPERAHGGWPARMLGVVNPRTLADGWVIKELLTTEWDLVVIDEAQSLSPRAEQAVQQLVMEGAVRRLLALGTWPTTRGPLGSIEGLHVESWELRHLGPNGLHAVDQVREFHPVYFDYSPEEKLLLRRVERLQEEVGDYRIDWEIRDVNQAASSSPYALQAHAVQALERLRSRRNALAHGRTTGDAATGHLRAAELRRLSIAVDELQALADAVDQLSVDSRYTAFAELLRAGPARLREEQIVIFCAEASTADYLANSLTTLERPIFQVRREGTLLADLSAALTTVNAVLVTDDDAVAGLDLVNARHVINYDLVPDVRRMRARWLSVGSAHRNPLEVWTLLDRSSDGLPEGRALQLMPYLAGDGPDRR
jgi:hypothetical protein